MSQRHEKTPRLEGSIRRHDRRKDRHQAKVLMHADQDDTYSGGVSRRSQLIVERAHTPALIQPKRHRHWKDAFWKRRTATRHAKNLAYEKLRDEELPITL